MQRVRRAPFMIAAAVILPLLIFFGLQFAFQAQTERAEVEAQALAKTERAVVESDGALQRTLGVLDAMSTAQPVAAADWQELYRRLLRFRRSEPSWVTVRVTDLRSGQVVFDLRQPFGARIGTAGFAPPPGPPRPHAFAGNMGGSGPGCPCALVYRYVGDGAAPPFLVTVALDTHPFLRMVSRESDPVRVFALVDRNGNFVARSLDHRRRVGTPATIYVRQAIRSGRSGIYSGKTWEGFTSYTAFTMSDLSGWSAHMAFGTSLIDSARWRSLGAGLFAALASLSLALVLVWYVLRELAEGRRVQERMQDSQKMEALGQITGGIAHDFNNLLTPIVGGIGIVARKAELDPGSRRMLESALSAGRRAAKVTGQLLAFSRRQRMEIGPVDLAALFAAIRPLLEQSAGPAIRIEIDVAEAARGISTDANQLELALLNLVLNSRDAMPKGGTISIAARPQPRLRNEPAMVDLTVHDTGEGMPREVLKRATEPFFTTKSAGSGTGLGLAQVYGIVNQSGGSIAIDSHPGEGTVVTLSLPACELPPPSDLQKAAPAPAAAATGQRILLCEDDDEVRTFVARVLEAAGYFLESVPDGRGAVLAVRNASIDLMVIDFAMHGMNGADVAAAVGAFRPHLPVLMITGYADSDAVAVAAPGIPVLRKPFEAEALLAAVADAIRAGVGAEGDA